MTITKWRLFTALAMLYAPVIAAQTAGNWSEASPQSEPPARSSPAMAYDSGHSQAVLFGGSNGTVLGDTWTWDGSNWTQQSPAVSPPARVNAAMVYDAAQGKVVLFGGATGPGTYLNDTWTWDGTNWTELSPKTVPPQRSTHSMAYDAGHGQVVLFGGLGVTGNALGDTWVWDATNWTQESPQASPSARTGMVMDYDSAHQQVILFGGSANAVISNGTLFNDTWVWDGTNWSQKSPQASPAARSNTAMVYDAAHAQTVLFAGFGALSTILGDTWLWDGNNWTQQNPQAIPPTRYKQAMVYDSVHNAAVLFGGKNAELGYLNDTWIWNGGALPPPGPSVSSVLSASGFGGFSSVAPGSWVEIYGSNLAPQTSGWTGADFNGNDAPTSLGGVSVSIGGQAAFVDYVSASQVNAQLPSGIPTGGSLPLIVTNADGASTPVNITVNPTEPGLLAPASFKVGGNQYVVAQHSDGSYVLPTGAISDVNSRPAKPGETVVIYGIGFGSVAPDISAGEIATEDNQLTLPLQILFGTTPAQLPYSGLAPNFVGLYQFDVVVPAVADSNLVPLSFSLGGATGTQTLFTTVQQ